MRDQLLPRDGDDGTALSQQHCDVNVERQRRYTYPEYHRLTNRIANMVRNALGLRRGDTALLILDNDNLSLLHFPNL